MPGMNGRHLADTLRHSQPSLPVLFISGYPADALSHHGVLDPGVDLLEKPYGPVQLLARVRRALDR